MFLSACGNCFEILAAVNSVVGALSVVVST